MIEMVVVLLLMSIIAATVLGRSITTSDMDLNSETDKIRNHLRFAQSEAMKRSNTVWGIKCSTEVGVQYYWLFSGTNPDLPANQIRLPGVSYAGTSSRARTADFGVGLNDFTVFFNRIGKPYTNFVSYTDETQNVPVSSPLNPLTVIVTANSQSRSITIIPETGLIR
jgi:type II secretory pathway pseudopilin PulG